jgi:membrane protein
MGMLEQVRYHGRAFVMLLRAAWVEYERDRAGYLAVAMIYYALVSLVPLFLLLTSALGLVLRFSPTAVDAERRLLIHMGDRFGTQLQEAIQSLLQMLTDGSIVATVIGIGGLLVTASVLFRHLRLGFRAIWKYEPPLVSGSVRVVVKTTILEQVIAFLMVLGGGGLLMAALLLMAVTAWLNRLLGRLPLFGETAGTMVTSTSSLVIGVMTFTVLFKFLPPVSIRWRDVWLGGLLCAVAWVVAGELLAAYGAAVGSSGNAYGAIGGLLAIMIWLKTVSQVLFFGAELCKVVATGRSVTNS